MATIGYVTKRDDGRYEGELKTLSVRASIAILPVGDKLSDNQPDFRAKMQDLEQATARFATIAGSGDQKQVAAELNKLVDACKACHKQYRSD